MEKVTRKGRVCSKAASSDSVETSSWNRDEKEVRKQETRQRSRFSV